MELNQISKSEDIGALRLLYDRVEAIVRSLQGIGVQADTYGTFLTPIIMGKLPSDLRLILSRHLGEQWNLDSLLKEFGVELQLREKCVCWVLGKRSRVQLLERAAGTNILQPHS